MYIQNSVRKYLELYTLLVSDQIFEESESKTKMEYIQNNVDMDKTKFVESIFLVFELLDDKILDFMEFFLSKILSTQFEDSFTEKFGSKLYYKIMKSEYNLYGKMTKIENETFNCLQIQTNYNDYDVIGRIIEIVQEKLRNEDDGEFKLAAKNLIKRTKLIKRYVNKLKNTENINNEGNEYSQIETFLNLLKILEDKKDLDKKVYFTYYSNFISLHLKYNNWSEAGIAQLNYIKMIDDQMSIKNDLNKKKTKLYKKCIQYFTNAKDWERCVYVCSQLEKLYLNEAHNFEKVAKILNIKAGFYVNMSNSETRFYPYYYRVVFTGNFDDELKLNEWVYRSRHLEQLNSFINRLLGHYTGSIFGTIKDGENPEKKYILILSVYYYIYKFGISLTPHI
ncbi:hypothetical protein MHBO_002473 [Bonamia ostreae]|uniref:DOCKER domain-containing protein n=1 Tax=Bonamia ostreae TaxID=126728 RepID=A0ABV2AN13_9EUKA